MFVLAGGAVGAVAEAECDLAAFEVAEEFVPFGVGGFAVFVAGPQFPAAIEKCPVMLDDVLG